MGFLAPWAFAGLALLLLPVAIHLLVRRRATRIDFPSLRYLRPTRSHQWAPRRLQQPLLLALRLVGLALLLLGLAQPFRSSAESQGKLTIILLDASFSMRSGQRGQAARDAASSAIGQMLPGERAAVIAFDTNGVVLVEPTSDRKALTDGLSRYALGYGTADYLRALATARSVRDRAGATETRILIVSDFQASGLRDESALRQGVTDLGIPVTTVPVGVPLERNSYWTGLAARASAKGWFFSATEMTPTVDGGSTSVSTGWRLSTATGNEPRITWHTESNGQIVGELHTEASDGFPDDDRVPFTVDRPARHGTLLVGDGTDGTDYLRAALSRIDRDESSDLIEAATFPVADGLDRYQLVVFTLHKNPDPEVVSRMINFCRGGGTVWLLLGADLNTDSWNEWASGQAGSEFPFAGLVRLDPAAQPRLNITDLSANQNDEVSYLDELTLASTPITAGYAISPRKEASVAMRWSNGQPAWVHSSVGNGTMIVFGTSLARESSGLGLSSVFPEMVDTVVEQSAEVPVAVYEIGTAPSPTSRGSEWWTITRPDGGTVSLTGREALLRSNSIFSGPGWYRMQIGGAERIVAFRPPASESEIALADSQLVQRMFASATSKGEAAKVSAPIRLATESRWWRWLVVFGFAVLCLEAIVALAKRTGTSDQVVPQAR